MTTETDRQPMPMCLVNPDNCPIMNLHTGAPQVCVAQVDKLYGESESSTMKEWIRENTGQVCARNLPIMAVFKAIELGEA